MVHARDERQKPERAHIFGSIAGTIWPDVEIKVEHGPDTPSLDPIFGLNPADDQER